MIALTHLRAENDIFSSWRAGHLYGIVIYSTPTEYPLPLRCDYIQSTWLNTYLLRWLPNDFLNSPAWFFHRCTSWVTKKHVATPQTRQNAVAFIRRSGAKRAGHPTIAIARKRQGENHKLCSNTATSYFQSKQNLCSYSTTGKESCDASTSTTCQPER